MDFQLTPLDTLPSHSLLGITWSKRVLYELVD